jgi:hypothetical protein
MTIEPHCRQVEVLLARRTVLRAIGTGVAMGLLPTGCSGVPPTLAPPPAQALVVLTPRTYAVFTAAAARLVGPRGAPLVLDRTIDVGTLADAWLARTPALAAPVGQALLLLELGVWPLLDKVFPFTALDGRAQDAVLEDCMTSRPGAQAKRLSRHPRARDADVLRLPGVAHAHGLPGTVRQRRRDDLRRHARLVYEGTSVPSPVAAKPRRGPLPGSLRSAARCARGGAMLDRASVRRARPCGPGLRTR